MIKLLDYVYGFIQKSVWVAALLLIFILSSKPLMEITQYPDAFFRGGVYYLFHLVWILTVVLGVYFVAKIISNILLISEPIFIQHSEDTNKESAKDSS